MSKRFNAPAVAAPARLPVHLLCPVCNTESLKVPTLPKTGELLLCENCGIKVQFAALGPARIHPGEQAANEDAA